MSNKINESFVSLITHKPLRTLVFSFVFLGILAPGFFQLKALYSARVWLKESHPKMVALNNFERNFGNDESLVITVHHPNGIFQPTVIKTIRSLTEGLRDVTDVVRVESLVNLNWITSQDDNIEIEPFIPIESELTENYLSLSVCGVSLSVCACF